MNIHEQQRKRRSNFLIKILIISLLAFSLYKLIKNEYDYIYLQKNISGKYYATINVNNILKIDTTLQIDYFYGKMVIESKEVEFINTGDFDITPTPDGFNLKDEDILIELRR